MHHGHFFEMPAFDLTVLHLMCYQYHNLIAQSDFRLEFEVKVFLTIGHMYAYVS